MSLLGSLFGECLDRKKYLSDLNEFYINLVGKITSHNEVIYMKINELAGIIQASVEQLNKAHDEILAKQAELLAKITDLEDALATAGEIPEEASLAIDALRASAQSLDDIVPDVIPSEPTPEVVPE